MVIDRELEELSTLGSSHFPDRSSKWLLRQREHLWAVLKLSASDLCQKFSDLPRKLGGITEAPIDTQQISKEMGACGAAFPRNSLNFLSLNNKKERTFSLKRGRLGACCLIILIFLIVLNVLRGRCDHATPTFADLNMIVYGMKHDSLWDET